MAVNLFTGATDNNWGTATNWSQGTVPTSSDGHTTTFDNTSPNCTVNTSNRTCNGIDFTGYTNTITMTFQITSVGSVTLASGMTISGSGNLVVQGTATLTSNGTTWPNNLQFTSASTTKTLADDWIVTGLFTSTNSIQTINGFSLRANGGLTSTATTNGTTLLVIGGGTWQQTQAMTCDVSLDGNITISGSISYSTGTLTYISGTITTTGSTLAVATNATTFDTGSVVWNNVSFTGVGAVMTLNSDFNIAGTITISNTNATTLTFNGNTMYLGGSITQGSTSAIVTGTTNIIYNGTGTWSSNSSQQIRNNFTINTVGTLTISGNVNYNTGTFIYTAGTVVTTGSTLTIGGVSTTLNTAGITFNNIIFTANSTMTINSLLTATGTVTITTVSVVFTGTAGWTFGTLIVTTGNQTLESGNTYTITTNFTATGTLANSSVFQASGSPTKAILILAQGATQDVEFCDPVRIDSSLGQTIWSYKGVLTTSFNWAVMPTQPQTYSE